MIFNNISNYNNALYKIASNNCKYFFPYSKTETQDISGTWPVLDTFLSTQNMRRNVYLQSILIFPPKI